MTTYRNFQIIKILKRSVFVLLAAYLFTACSSLQTSSNYFLNKNEGLVVFSMTESGVLSSQYQVVLFNEKTKTDYAITLRKGDQYDIGFKESDSASHRSFDNPVGKLVVLRLPEGIYSLKHWPVKAKKKLGSNSLKRYPNKKFRVMSGHSLYLGNFHLLSSETKNSFFIADNRIRDLPLFYQRYPQVDKSKLLVASKLLLDPASGRDRVFSAYTACEFQNYKLFSKKRLPPQADKFRKLIIGDKEKKVSRIDGFRLKYEPQTGEPELRIKVELSDNSDYISDKEITKSWIETVARKSERLEADFKEKPFFSEYRLKTDSVQERNMVYMTVMFDDINQIITSMIFVNPAEYQRAYKTVESFIPSGVATVSAMQQCVLKQLNNTL